jgi:hypothetical protein
VTEPAVDPPLFVSRFAEPTRVDTVQLGPCRCPGTPHGEDTALMRSEIGDGELRAATAKGGFSDGTGVFNGARSDDQCIAEFTLSWTLLGNDSQPAPITAAKTRLALLAQINKASLANRRPLPNGSGAPSRASSRGSASRRRTKPRG